MKYEWTGAGHQALPTIWPAVQQLIQTAMIVDDFEIIDPGFYWERINDERMQLWCLYDQEGLHGVMLTEVVKFQGEVICNIPVCAGADIEEWTEFLAGTLEPWAMEQGCTRIEFSCRKGIAKVLARHSYYVSNVILTKHLDYRKH